jgi:hypothetical protein
MIMPAGFASDRIDSFVPVLKPLAYDENAEILLEGEAPGEEIIHDSEWSDINGNKNIQPIGKLIGEEVINRYDGSLFKPNQAINGYEALEFLVHFDNPNAQIRENILNNSQGLEESTINASIKDAYLQAAENNGIILPQETFNLNEKVTKELLSQWLFRVSNLQLPGNDLSEVVKASDYDSIESAYVQRIESLLNEEVLSLDGNNNFNPKSSLSKGEFARALNQLSVVMAEARGIEEVKGIVVDEVVETTDQGKTRQLFIRSNDNTVLRVTSEKDASGNRMNDYVVLKNNQLQSSDALSLGDQVVFYHQDDSVYFVEALKDITLSDVFDSSEEGTKVLMASVKEISNETYNKDGEALSRKRIRLMALDGNSFDLVLDTDENSQLKEMPLLYKEGAFQSPSTLIPGEQVTLLIKDNKDVIYMRVTPFEKQYLTGTIRSIDDTVLELFDYDNQINRYPIAKDVVVTMNRRPTSLDSLAYGYDIIVELNNGLVTAIEGETFINPGYIPDFGKVRMGKVIQKFGSGLLVQLNDGKEEFYTVTSDTIILKENINVLQNAIREGDRVKFYFNDIYTKDIAKIEVEGYERIVDGIYKGQLKSFNQGSMKLRIANPEYLKNVTWIPSDNYYKEIRLDEKVKIYDKDREISLENFISRYREREVYIVAEKSYAEEKAIQVVVKTGNELVMNDKLRQIDRTLNRFELGNNQNLNYSDGTIVVKNGRVITSQSLQPDDSVVAITERNGGVNTANVVNVTAMDDDMFNNIYFGTLKDVYFNSITLDNYTFVDNHKFRGISRSDTDPFYVFTETDIVDLTDEDNKEVLSINDLFHGSYSEGENESDEGGVDYHKYYTYFIADDANGIIGMRMRFKGLLEGQNFDDDNSSVRRANDDLEETLDDVIFTKGILIDVDDNQSRFQLTSSHDYINYRERWVLNNVDTYIEYDDAIIIRNNEEISPDDIDTGEYLYAMRINENALIIFVEDE